MSGEEPPPRLFTPLYWAAMAGGLLLILAGAAVSVLGPRVGHGSLHRKGPANALTGPGAHGRGADPPVPTP